MITMLVKDKKDLFIHFVTFMKMEEMDDIVITVGKHQLEYLNSVGNEVSQNYQTIPFICWTLRFLNSLDEAKFIISLSFYSQENWLAW